jgi:hypothetical protein
MINTIGTVQLTQDSLAAYSSPKITVIGQSSNSNVPGILQVTLSISNQNLTELSSTIITIPINDIATSVIISTMNASTFISNLYSIIEQIFIEYLISINPNTTFEIG